MTIREQIIAAIATKVAGIKTTGGYNTNCGDNIKRAIKIIEVVPACIIWPMPEEQTKDYGENINVMPVKIEGIVEYGAENPSVVSEQILGDLIENILGTSLVFPFTSGGTYEVKVSDTVTGATGSATGYVVGIEVTGGTWAGGDAAGNLTIRRLTGTFEAENLDVGANLNVCTIPGTFTATRGRDSTTNNLAEQIEYIGGGTEEYPEGEDKAVGAYILVNIKYYTVMGDPYHQ